MKFPRLVKARQKIDSPKLDDYASAIRKELAGISEVVKPGSSIAITAGSRGVTKYSKILAIVVEEVRKVGGEPFLVPAMGSHGGATAEGQIKVLSSLGITSETVGARIYSSMEVEEIGRLENGVPVYMDRYALKSDGIIVVGRVKPHTDYKGKIESGLLKMIAIGLGKQKGAEMIHWHQSEGYHKIIPQASRLAIQKTPIIMGLAVVENARHEIAEVKALKPEEIEEEEVKLLEKAKKLMARIPFKELDVLIVEEIGKNISGVGMDTNVVGRFWLPGESDPRTPEIKRIVVLDLSEETQGSAVGIGLADVTTSRAVSKIDYQKTYVNCLTAAQIETSKIPVHLPSDRDAIAASIRLSGPIDPKETKLMRIRNTLELERFWISENLAETLKTDPKLQRRVEVLGEPREMQFDVLGTLAR